ncbi:serine/threonine-protein kinase [Amycolatopsis sp. BJA-103]|uniref:serine/threonine-protein kinase n=1 Tax=Amycolatopsis sp. BJA-103 TaxID=1911175 RepID=UPI000C75C2A1|nr:serine/threonine-protein kinase [Amycolatopsis sp. BJA-103]AUI61287.1 serine/threonine protein kinase [Amycolatopsis sp. BJA-103]PNE21421.1 serine/threonine protein kinase [Amycolatopsis sp. BJA-103]
MGDRLIAGRYRLEERIGAGGMGVVWRATDQDLGRVVALKRSQAGDSGQIRREARIGAGLHHPNVVTVFDAVMDGDDRWLVMEYLPSRSLADVIDADGPLSPGKVAKIGVQLANALAAMHEKGMVHRDLKPGNVLVAEDGTAKLTDLGIAQWAEVTRTGGGLDVGTPGYLAPEMAEGHQAGAAADVFSLGATLFTAVEGTSVWGDPNSGPFVQLRRATSYTLEPIRQAGTLAPVLTELLRRKPAGRPNAVRAAELLAEVADVAAPARSRQVRVTKRAVAIGSVAAALVLVGGLVYALKEPASMAAAPRPADSVGDLRTADPCALVDPSVLKQFGTPELDTANGNFNACGILLRMSPDDGDIVDVRLELTIPKAPLLEKPVPGRLSVREVTGQPEEKCERVIPLPDGNQVWVHAKHIQDWHAHLCDYVDPVAVHATAVLNREPIKRRPVPFPAGSLGSLDACALGGDSPSRVVGGPAAPDPVFGNWECYWNHRDMEVTIRFEREWAPFEDGGTRLALGSREAFVEISSEWEACQAEIPHRTFTGDGRAMIETVEIYVSDKVKKPQEMCPAAERLARDIAPRLPSL